MSMISLEMYEKLNSLSLDNLRRRDDGRSAGSAFAIFRQVQFPLLAINNGKIINCGPEAVGASEIAKETTRIVLEAAEDMGNRAVQEKCLFELIRRESDEPLTEIERMSSLLITAGNATDELRLRLFSAVFVKSDTEKKALRRLFLHETRASYVKDWRPVDSLCFALGAQTHGEKQAHLSQPLTFKHSLCAIT